jgi:hypothetical protein
MDGLFHRKKARFPLRAVLNRTKDVRTGLNEIRGVKMGKTVTCLSERLGHGIDQFAKTGDWTKISRFDSRRSKNTRNRRGIQARAEVLRGALYWLYGSCGGFSLSRDT